MKQIKQTMKDICPECEGEGTIYEDTSRQCMKRMNDCCGGCGYDVECDNCNGTGEVECEFGCDDDVIEI